MQEVDKTKEQLVVEVAHLRQRIAQLEQAEIKHKRAEEALKESEEDFRALADNAADGITILASDGTHAYVNRRAAEIVGYTVEELLQVGFQNLFPQDERTRLAEIFKKKLKGESDTAKYETVIIRKDGTRVPLEVSSAITTWHGKPADIVFSRDITERKQIEDELKLKDNAIASALTAIAIGEFRGNLTYVNPAFSQMWGYDSEEEILGRAVIEFWHEKEKAQEIIEALRKGKNVMGELVAKRKDGSLFNVQLSASIVTDEASKPVSMMASFVDITERKRAEEALRESQQLLVRMFASLRDAVFILDADTVVIKDCNRAAAEIFGYSHKEMLGRTTTFLHVDEAALEKFREHLYPAIEEKGFLFLQKFWMKRKDGTIFPTEHNVMPLEDEQGTRIGWVSVVRDVTEHKQAEEALRESEERYRTVLENIEDGYYEIDLAGRFIFVNDVVCENLGYSRDELIGTDNRQYQDEITAKKLYEIYNEVYKTGEPVKAAESEFIRKDGTKRTYEMSVSLIRDAHGEPIGYRGISRDVTERKRVQEALKKSEEKYRTVVELSPDGVAIASQGRHVFANKSLARIFGVSSPDDLLGKPIMDYIHPDYRKIVRERLGTQTKRGLSVPLLEEKMLRADGTVIHTEVAAAPLEYEGTQAVLAVIRDITERKEMENTLRESEEKYRSLVESSDDSIYLINEDCIYLFMNKKHLSRMDIKSSDVIGKTYSEFHSPEETNDFSQKIKKVLKTRKSLSYEYKSQRDNRYFIRTLSPVKTPDVDKPSVVTVISKDVTELKQTAETLREREAFNFALFHYNPVETIVVDSEGRVIGFNLAKEKSGDRLPIIGDLMYRDYAGKHEIDMSAELMHCIKSGNVKAFPERRYGAKYLSITISPFSQGALIISEDITERKSAEELLQKERDTFFSILQKAPYGVVLVDNHGKAILSNIEFTNITGYTLKDIPTLRDWFRLAYPDRKYRDMVMHTLRRDAVQADGDKTYQREFHRAFFRIFKVTCKDGTVKEIEFRPTIMEDGGTIIMLADITERKRMNELLEAAATEWRTTFDAISDAVCLLDSKGRIKRCNNSMLDMIGKPFSEIIDRPCWEVMHGGLRPPQGCIIQRMQETHHRETEQFSKDDRWLNISFDPLLDEGGNYVGGVHIMSDITERIQAEKELQKSQEQLRNLTAYLESVREQERTVIAREIHDELAQALTALKMDLSWLESRLPQDQTDVIAKKHSMNDLIDTTIQTVKRISAELRPGVLDDLGLVAAIEWQAEEFQNRTGIVCHVTADPLDMTVDQERSTAIFRIFQETLTNVARHAHATRVRVSLKMKKGTLTLRVKDNGKGITEDQIIDSRSFGIIGMRERVYPWGGKVTIKGTSGKGTTVLVSVSVEKREHALSTFCN